jgi:hypothetical protein
MLYDSTNLGDEYVELEPGHLLDRNPGEGLNPQIGVECCMILQY